MLKRIYNKDQTAHKFEEALKDYLKSTDQMEGDKLSQEQNKEAG